MPRDAPVRIAEAPEGEAADLPERRIRGSDRYLMLLIGEANEALGFPIEIIAADGRTVLATTTARAEAGWASTGTVPWSAVLVFNAPHGSSGYVLFKNDNPSGDPSKEKTLQVPVRFQ